MKLFPYGVIEPSKIPEIADRILDEYFEITRQLGIKACLAFGLCLGFVRDGGYIDGDNDLDVVAIGLSDEERNKLIGVLVESGFSGGFFHPPSGNGHFYKDRILLDIFFRQPERFYASFDAVQYKNKSYPVPHPIEEYLQTCYSNWKTPGLESTRYYG